MTGMMRRYALANSVVDIPNLRSSHKVPTPRGGGVAIVLTFLLLTPWFLYSGLVPVRTLVGLMGGGAWIAIIGFLDDHGHVPAKWRLLAHFAGAAWMLGWMGRVPPLVVFGHPLELHWAGWILATLYLVWLLNLYNFMDGIDGIAGIEAITVCCGAALVAVCAGTSTAVPPLLLAAAVAGFLFWNFPRARIFMGDAGSGFLGIILGGLSIQAALNAPQLLWSWLILLGVFIVDATVTLIRRLLRREKVYEAHRSHAYQYLSRKLGSHPLVSLGVGGINLIWLTPLASLVAIGAIDGVWALLLAYLPLLLAAFHWKAGARELQEI